MIKFTKGLDQIKTQIESKVTERNLIQTQLNALQKTKNELKRETIIKERALEFVKSIALKTQNQLEFHLSDMVSTGLNTVFEQEYNFKVIFEIKRGKTECQLFFQKDDNLIDPLTMSGLGAADIASFCLRCAGYSMNPIYRSTFILDEPFKHLSVAHHEKAAQMIKMLSQKLGIQIIMVTHSEVMTNHADKVFKVKMVKSVSKVQEI